jgi:hypothetical protein
MSGSLGKLDELRLGSERSMPAGTTLIVVIGSMDGQPVELPSQGLPCGCSFSSNLNDLSIAAAVVFHIPSLAPRLRLPKRRGQLWVAWSMESDENYPQLRDAEYMSRFDLTMTYRLDSDVPTTYVSYYSSPANLARALRNPPRPKQPGQLAALLISAAVDRSGRQAYAAELMRYLHIHSYGRVLNNCELPEDRGRPSKLELISGYKFTLAFENSITRDYVTEKFFDPLVAGSVPIYIGAPNIEEFAPGDRCFINVDDFSSPRSLAEFVLDLDHDDTAYGAYMAWRQHPYRETFRRLLEISNIDPMVRLCQAVQSRLRGAR